MKGVFSLEWVKVVLMVSILAKIKAKHLAQLSFFCLSVLHTRKCEYEEQKFRLCLLGRIMRQLSFIEGRSVNGILCIQRVRNFMLRFNVWACRSTVTAVQKLIIAQLANKFPVPHETRRFIPVFIKDHHWTSSWRSWINFIPTRLIYFRSILLLSFILRF
jgi:hypothetical protein